jgi:cyclopropane fatty-acyl-phospholipid synthase-like methyltransferase
MTTSEALYDAAYFQRIRAGSELYERFASVLPIAAYRQKRILDIGCGRGELVRHLIDSGCTDVTGFDFASAAIQEARKTVGDPPAGARVEVRQGSVTRRDLFATCSFDLAFMTDVVEHLPPDDLHAGLQNARYWLAPSGRLVVHTFPTLGPHRFYQRTLELRLKTKELAELAAIHCNVQTRKSLRMALEQAGFVVEDIWLRNDFTLTSSAYQTLRPGLFKNLLGELLDNVLGSAPVRFVFGEYAAPSIYAIARRPDC